MLVNISNPFNKEELLVQELSQAIKARKLAVPVRLLLEMHLPLAGIGQFFFELLRPFLGLVISSEKLEVLNIILAKPVLLEHLVANLNEE